MPGGRPKGPPREKLNTCIDPQVKATIFQLALERHGSPRAMGRVIEDAVGALLREGNEHQELAEELVSERQAAGRLRKVAADLAREKEEYRRQLERIGVLSPSLVRRTRRASKESGGGQVLVPREWIQRAAQTLCGAGCGCFMDPPGLMQGLSACPDCR